MRVPSCIYLYTYVHDRGVKKQQLRGWLKVVVSVMAITALCLNIHYLTYHRCPGGLVHMMTTYPGVIRFAAEMRVK